MQSTHKPRLLWANCYCLLDTTSGASLAVHEMLCQLVQHGYEISILGATNFDNPQGANGLQEDWETIKKHQGKVVEYHDGLLLHKLYVTESTNRSHMKCYEEELWYNLYRKELESFQPDIVYYYGGAPLDHLIALEARTHNIPVAFYVANGSYTSLRWARDVDCIFTDSQATATLYNQRFGIHPIPIGAFIRPETVVAPTHTHQHLLFINPVLEKGAAIVIRLAMLLEQRRPDIVFEIVESRGKWVDFFPKIAQLYGEQRRALNNVVVTPNTNDMRPIYGRARLLLAPSLWWESAGRVLIEALMNGIPVITTNNGGGAEMVQKGGFVVALPERYYQKPYNAIPSDTILESMITLITSLYDNPVIYQRVSVQAIHVGQTHYPEQSIQRLLKALQPLVERQAGNNNAGLAIKQL